MSVNDRLDAVMVYAVLVLVFVRTASMPASKYDAFSAVMDVTIGAVPNATVPTDEADVGRVDGAENCDPNPVEKP